MTKNDTPFRTIALAKSLPAPTYNFLPHHLLQITAGPHPGRLAPDWTRSCLIFWHYTPPPRKNTDPIDSRLGFDTLSIGSWALQRGFSTVLNRYRGLPAERMLAIQMQLSTGHRQRHLHIHMHSLAHSRRLPAPAHQSLLMSSIDRKAF